MAQTFDQMPLESLLLTPATLAAGMDPGWKFARHHKLICRELLQLLYQDRRECHTLACSVPPRHGKTTFLAVYFPAWYLLHNPSHRIVLLGYEERFAAEQGEKVRNIVDLVGARSGVQVSKSSHSKSEWSIEGHGGGMSCRSIMGGYNGKGANILIVDDPVKDINTIRNATFRAKIWETFLSCALTRLEDPRLTIMIMARFHPEDPVGLVLASEDWKAKTREIRIPAISEGDGDPLGRPAGEVIWPERNDTSLAALTEKRSLMLSNGDDLLWDAIYQQRPRYAASISAECFEKAHAKKLLLTTEELAEISSVTPAMQLRFWDLGGAGTKSDFTASCRMDVYAGLGLLVVRDLTARKFQKIEHVEQHVVDVVSANDPKHVVQHIESVGGFGQHTVQLYRKSLAGWPVLGEMATSSQDGNPRKVAQFNLLLRAATRNQIKFMPSIYGTSAWNEFLSQCADMPSPRHDDVVDAVSGACSIAIRMLPHERRLPCSAKTSVRPSQLPETQFSRPAVAGLGIPHTSKTRLYEKWIGRLK